MPIYRRVGLDRDADRAADNSGTILREANSTSKTITNHKALPALNPPGVSPPCAPEDVQAENSASAFHAFGLGGLSVSAMGAIEKASAAERVVAGVFDYWSGLETDRS